MEQGGLPSVLHAGHLAVYTILRTSRPSPTDIFSHFPSSLTLEILFHFKAYISHTSNGFTSWCHIILSHI